MKIIHNTTTLELFFFIKKGIISNNKSNTEIVELLIQSYLKQGVLISVPQERSSKLKKNSFKIKNKLITINNIDRYWIHSFFLKI
jgi:hypothetical protein